MAKHHPMGIRDHMRACAIALSTTLTNKSAKGMQNQAPSHTADSTQIIARIKQAQPTDHTKAQTRQHA